MSACQLSRSLPARLLILITFTLLIATAATAEWIDLGGNDPVTVELLESSGSRTVYAITIGGFEAEPVTVYTCDLSYEYVRINAEYHT